MPVIFPTVYHERIGIAGLHYIALGIGLSAASQFNVRYMDRIYIHFKNKNGGVGEPEFRLRQLGFSSVPLFRPAYVAIWVNSASMIPGTVLLPIGLLLTGWSAHNKLHWIAADIVCLIPRSVMPLWISLVCFIFIVGHRLRWCGYDTGFPSRADLRCRRVHFACCFWYVYYYYCLGGVSSSFARVLIQYWFL